MAIWKNFMVKRFHQKHDLETIFNVQNYWSKGALLAHM